MKPYNPANWYWIVGGDATRVFSSAIGDYVPVADPTFVQWKSDGTDPTIIDTEDSLGDVMAQASVRPVTAAILDSYKTSQARSITIQVISKWCFNQENRLRACERALSLNGSPPNITAQQVVAFLKQVI